MPITCISFDLDDTLWECDSVIARAEQGLFDWLAAEMPAVTAIHDVDDLALNRRAFAQRNPEIGFDITALRRRWLQHMADEFGYPDADIDAGFDLFLELRNKVTLYHGVVELLHGLRDRYQLGAITNGNADVHKIGIGHLFHFVVSAADAAAAKPDPAIFELAARHSGRPYDEILHVGDDPVRDVRGAAELGMRTAWINPRLAPWPGGKTPDLVLREVTELESALAQLKA